MVETLIAWSLILIPMMFSPGATNILVSSTGASFGIRNTHALILGINVGIALQILVVALGISIFFTNHPHFFMVLHYLGVGYMFYLAYKFFTAPHFLENNLERKAKKASFVDGVLVELLNPKVWLSLIAIFAAFTKDASSAAKEAIFFAVLTIVLNLINNFTWAFTGAYIMRKLFVGPLIKIQNYLYGLMMVSVGVWMMVDNIKI